MKTLYLLTAIALVLPSVGFADNKHDSHHDKHYSRHADDDKRMEVKVVERHKHYEPYSKYNYKHNYYRPNYSPVHSFIFGNGIFISWY